MHSSQAEPLCFSGSLSGKLGAHLIHIHAGSRFQGEIASTQPAASEMLSWMAIGIGVCT